LAKIFLEVIIFKQICINAPSANINPEPLGISLINSTSEFVTSKINRK
jgi:hypothetical protein